MHRVYIALGTNMGDRWAHLRRAIEHVRDFIQVDGVSPVYETEPWGGVPQPDFLNAVLTGLTDLAPHPLLARLKEVEWTLGRRPTVRYGPRVIDLDILLYDDLCLDTPDLVIPHPRMHERAFVLVPLADLAPDAWHPCQKQRIRDLAAQVDTSGVWRAEGRRV